MPINIQEGYRIPDRVNQKRNSSCHIIVKTPNAQNKERILKAVRGTGQVTYMQKELKKLESRQSYNPILKWGK